MDSLKGPVSQFLKSETNRGHFLCGFLIFSGHSLARDCIIKPNIVFFVQHCASETCNNVVSMEPV